MKLEDEPVTEDELVLRLIWRDFYKAVDPVTVKPRAFHPRPDETTGISVFGWACLKEPSNVLSALPDPLKRPLYIIAALRISELKVLGLTVTPNRIEAVPGHALLSELNCTSWANEKAIWLPRVEKLAEFAGQRVVYKPALS